MRVGPAQYFIIHTSGETACVRRRACVRSIHVTATVTNTVPYQLLQSYLVLEMNRAATAMVHQIGWWSVVSEDISAYVEAWFTKAEVTAGNIRLFSSPKVIFAYLAPNQDLHLYFNSLHMLNYFIASR
jgi:hypothetical protein